MMTFVGIMLPSVYLINQKPVAVLVMGFFVGGPDESNRSFTIVQMYVMPAGTTVSIRNLLTGERIARYVTRKQLSFISISGTGYDGLLLYFKHGKWEICVHRDRLR
ncbi:hypothetical protein N9Y42_01670 [Mariniblastus sp.]|nr:hypothetical protein [Mariniblastus sp.]